MRPTGVRDWAPGTDRATVLRRRPHLTDSIRLVCRDVERLLTPSARNRSPSLGSVLDGLRSALWALCPAPGLGAGALRPVLGSENLRPAPGLGVRESASCARGLEPGCVGGLGRRGAVSGLRGARSSPRVNYPGPTTTYTLLEPRRESPPARDPHGVAKREAPKEQPSPGISQAPVPPRRGTAGKWAPSGPPTVQARRERPRGRRTPATHAVRRIPSQGRPGSPPAPRTSGAQPVTDLVADRHIGPRPDQRARMLDAVGHPSLDALVDAAAPPAIRSAEPLDLPPARTEAEMLANLRAIAAKNRVMTQMIGQGYFPTVTPAVIRRGVLETPAWYTAYTPYQPEISQGRLEALLNFQTLVADLTALPIAQASLLDEATAVAEAVALMHRAARGKDGVVLIDADLFPQSLDVTLARARAAGLGVRVVSFDEGFPSDDDARGESGDDSDSVKKDRADDDGAPVLGVVVQQPGASGRVRDLAPIIAAAKERGALVTVATDLLALTMLTPPGELGADLAVGSAQRLGVPLFYGGPHAAFIAVREGLERTLPGRLVGVSIDAHGEQAYRLALQTREQHIRREKATSNICTAQALLAVVASMFAVYHGPEGLRQIAERTHDRAVDIARGLQSHGVRIEHEHFFDTVRANVPPARAAEILAAAAERGINVWADGPTHVQVATSEATTPEHVAAVVDAFVSVLSDLPEDCCGGGCCDGPRAAAEARDGSSDVTVAELPASLLRTSEYLTHPVFRTHRSETAMMRYLRRLADRDLALDRTMIPLGSCTMKLNPAAAMEPISWPEFADVHPFVPREQAAGYTELIDQLSDCLARITGYAKVSVQPNAGSQGEFAGLLAIRDFHRAQGHGERDVVLIPASAHGTNAASAALAGMRVVVVATHSSGEVDLNDLRAKIEANAGRVAAIMITYPSTHGVFEEHVREVCGLVHEAGGQVYIDGANLNALVGLARPGRFGGDVSHLNLHKTFCIPHGGGGPGVGPVAVAEHLVPFLPTTATPGTATTPADDGASSAPRISAAPYGSAGILQIPWAYIATM